jgi:hypothetical protein
MPAATSPPAWLSRAERAATQARKMVYGNQEGGILPFGG